MLTTEFLTVTAAVCPDRPSILFEGKRITFEQLNERSNRLANALTKLGIKKGERVAFLHVNCYQGIETYFACAKIGAIYVPLNFRAKADEITFMVNNSEARVVFAGARYLESITSLKDKLTTVKHVVGVEGKATGVLDYEQIVTSASADEAIPESEETDTTILMFTAGTTGFPKGVMLTHNSFVQYVVNNVTPVDIDVAEKNILTVPLYHIAGIQAVMAAIYGGRTLVIQRQFDAEEWMKLVQTEKVDRAMMVPTMLKQLMDNANFQKYNLSSLKVITYGAAPMPLEVIKRAIQVFPKTQFINAFGQTESAATITMLGPEDHVITGTPEEREKKLKRLSSIGKPLPDVEVKVFDENGKEVQRGTVGEIVTKGARVMKGYWKQEDATSKTIDKGGWLHTGDLGYQDEAGYIFLAGRAKDIIKRGGEMISPEEVENVLMAHPKVEEAAIIGVPDNEWGERVRAIVVTKKSQKVTPDELIEFCRKRLSSYKKPESVVFVDELPRNPMGKVLKRVLREQFNKPIIG